MSYNEECKGCTTYHSENNNLCGLLPNLNGVVCPCVDCLIKAMCEKECDLFDIYVNREGFR